MASLVGIHGIEKTYDGPETLATVWGPPLRDGVRLAGREPPPVSSFAMAFYGDLFRRSGTKATDVPRLEVGDIDEAFEDGWETDLLVQWWASAAAADTEVQPPGGDTKARTPQLVQRALKQLAKSAFIRGWGGERMLIFGLKQVRGYLFDPTVRREARARLGATIGADTRVIVAHSLGSVVAYEWLCGHPGHRVDTLVTLGSPLGIPNLIFERLEPTPEGGRGTWPGVRRWVNVADTGDLVALEKQLARSFGEQIEDVLVHNGWASHDVVRYLSAQETGAAIADGLGI